MALLNDSPGLDLGLIIVALSFVLYAVHRFKSRRLFKLAEKIPGPKGLPIVGNLLEVSGSPNDLFLKLYENSKKFKDVMKLWIGPRLIVFIYNPVDVEIILSSQVHIDKSPEYRFFEPWLGDGLLISTGEKWRSHRKIIAPTFHINILKSFFQTFNRNSKDVVERLNGFSGKEFDCHDIMSETTVEILLETVMGVNKKNQDNAFNYAMAVMKMCDILHLRHTKLWLRSDLIFNLSSYSGVQKSLTSTIHNLTRKVLHIRKTAFKMGQSKELPENMTAADDHKIDETLESSKNKSYMFGQSAGLKDDLDDNDNDVGIKKRMAFLDLLVQNSQDGVRLTDEEIQNQVDTIMFEGHDTTAAASSFFLTMMAAHPKVQEKVVEELNGIFQGSHRDVTFQDTVEMKYLERCIMETLRMYPPVPIIARELKEEVKLNSSDIIIPTGCTVVVTTYKLHRREDVFQNPDVFNPDNFLPENSANRHYYSYIPFSAGPRSCVGRKYAMLKLKVLLSTLLRNFKILPGLQEKDWLLQGDIILKRSDGFPITIQPRTQVKV